MRATCVENGPFVASKDIKTNGVKLIGLCVRMQDGNYNDNRSHVG